MAMGGRVTVHDLAREAGVSLATVDRVLNGRPGVRAVTIEKVEAAIAAIGFKRDLTASMLARARAIGLMVIVPDGTNQFMAKLAEAAETIGAQMGSERLRLVLKRVKAMDSRALADALDAIAYEDTDCAAIVAIDKPDVHAAVERASRRGIKIITLVSDLPSSARRSFVGIDNRAAGRTAGALMGRFLHAGAKIGVVAGSLQLRDHAERIAGFKEIIESEFDAMRLAGPIEGQDEFTATYERTLDLLSDEPDLAGLYNAGAGNAGLLMAIEEKGLSGKIRVIAHELTGPTRAGLLSGAVDIVLDQAPEDEIRAVCAAARRLVLGPDAAPPPVALEIKVFLAHNLR